MRRTCGRERKQIPRLEGSTRMESVDANERRCLHTRAHTHTHTHTLGEGDGIRTAAAATGDPTTKEGKETRK